MCCWCNQRCYRISALSEVLLEIFRAFILKMQRICADISTSGFWSWSTDCNPGSGPSSATYSKFLPDWIFLRRRGLERAYIIIGVDWTDVKSDIWPYWTDFKPDFLPDHWPDRADTLTDHCQSHFKVHNDSATYIRLFIKVTKDKKCWEI